MVQKVGSNQFKTVHTCKTSQFDRRNILKSYLQKRSSDFEAGS